MSALAGVPVRVVALMAALTAALSLHLAAAAEAADGGPGGAVAPESADGRSGRCGGGDDPPIQGTRESTAKTMVCLVNDVRRRHDAPALRLSPVLERAATSYSVQMVERRFFSHVSPSGGTLAERLRDTGYMRRHRRWAVGENLGWGTGPYASPASILSAWEHSPSHRANLLDRQFREVGVGVSFATPTGGTGVTYAIEFGVRG